MRLKSIEEKFNKAHEFLEREAGNKESEKQIENIKDEDDSFIEKEKAIRHFQRFAISLFLFLAIIWLLFFCVLGMQSAPNDDMSPRVDGGDMCFYYRLNKSPGINDIVFFEKNDLTYLGRVIARGGDTVEIIKSGGIKINGNNLTENKIFYGTQPYANFVQYPLTLKEDEYFILTDNREKGEDSRYFGPVKKSELKGTLIGIFRRTNL
jgi:signal peptidase I